MSFQEYVSETTSIAPSSEAGGSLLHQLTSRNHDISTTEAVFNMWGQAVMALDKLSCIVNSLTMVKLKIFTKIEMKNPDNDRKNITKPLTTYPEI